MQIDNMQRQIIAGLPCIPVAVADQKMAQVKITMIHPGRVKSPGRLGQAGHQSALELKPRIPLSAQRSGILFLRVATTAHADMIALVADLRTYPAVAAVAPDVLLGARVTTHDNGGTPAGWTWDLNNAGSNWGLELIRAPQMWNLNAAVRKAGDTTAVGVLDSGFRTNHPDLVYHDNRTPGTQAGHGTHVAGIIGARFDNSMGIDGVNPFTNLIVQASGTVITGTTGLARGTSWGEGFVYAVDAVVNGLPQLRVLNMSMGYPWTSDLVNTTTSVAAQALAAAQGAIYMELLANLAAAGLSIPLIVTAAGNESATISQEARFGSPMNNAALAQGEPNTIVVEALNASPGSTGGATRRPSSNLNGTISAPGGAILSTYWSAVNDTVYHTLNGTSMAAPHVAGLAGFLIAVDPELTNADLRTLLIDNAVLVSGASNRIDAFATVMDVDRIRGGDRVLRMLVDVDDGTPDGNLRTSALGSEFTDDVNGDGRIDMSDFRRWRDWALQIHYTTAERLDGRADHPKRDLNGDRRVDASAMEDVFPRGDFNGDGNLTIDPAITRRVPGALNREVGDLEMLQHVFDDPHYQASALPGLIESADLHVDATPCLTQTGVAAVVTSIELRGTDTMLEERNHSTGEPSHIYTVSADPVNGTGYLIKAEALDSAGQVVGATDQDTTLLLSEDVHWQPICVAILNVTPRNVTMHVDSTRQFTASGAAGAVNRSATGGSITSTGLYTAGATPGTFQLRAIRVQNPDVRDSTTVTVVPGPFQGTWQGLVGFFFNNDSIGVPLLVVLTQNGSSVTGPWVFSTDINDDDDPMRGTWTGSLNGNEMSFTAVLTGPTTCSGSGSGTLALVSPGVMEGGGTGGGTCEIDGEVGSRSFTFRFFGMTLVPPEPPGGDRTGS
jgi:subtilisin family serine protease